jgi:hypothetical protein
MSKSIFITVLIIAISGLAQAQGRTRVQSQSNDEARKTQVFVLAGLGNFSGAGGNAFQIGGGLDTIVYKGLSVGGEISHLTVEPNQFLLSGNVAYHILNGRRANRIDPFATFGYTRFMRSSLVGPDANAINFGGGVNFWLSNKFGLRADLRDHIGTAGGSMIGLRGGLVLGF